jgi:hypothetical protein
VFSSLQYPQQPFPGNDIYQWRFFSFPRSGPSCPANIPQLNSQFQLNYSAIFFSASLADLS